MDNSRMQLSLFADKGLFWSIAGAMFLASAVFYLRTYDSATIKITIAQLGTLIALCFWFIKTIETGRLECALPSKKILLPGLLFLGWIIISFSSSPYKLGAMDDFIKAVIFAVLFCIGCAEFNTLYSVKRLTDWLLASALVITIYGFMQKIGFDPFIWKGAFGSRIFSTLCNPDLLAAFLAGVFPLALTGFLSSIQRHSSLIRPISNLRSLLSFVLLCLIAINLVYSFSAKGIIAFGAMILVSAFFCWRFLKNRMRKIALAVIAFILLLIAVFSATEFSKLSERAAYDAAFLKHTWAGTINMIKKHPLLGTGSGSFRLTYPEFRKPEIIKLEGKHNTETDHCENELLEIWSETGLPGLILFLWIFIQILRAAIKKLRFCAQNDYEHETLWLAGLSSMAIGFIFIGMFNALATRFIAPGAMFWLFAGALAGVSSTMREQNMKFWVYPIPFSITTSRLFYIPAALAVLFCGVWPVKWFISDINLNKAIYFSKQENWDKALPLYDKVAPGHPAYVMAQYFKGNVLADINKPETLEQAVAQFEKVRSLAPNYVQVHQKEGNILVKLGRYQAAIERFEHQTELDPILQETWLRLSELYRKTGSDEKAVFAEKTANSMIKPTLP